MPEKPQQKVRPHPIEAISDQQSAVSSQQSHGYAELHVTSNFTFLTGASHPDELVEQAAMLGYHAIAITDVNSVAGIVRAHVAAEQAGVRLVVGCHLKFALTFGEHEENSPLPEGPGVRAYPAAPSHLSILVYPTDVASYGRLCRLLTIGKRRAEKGACRLHLHDLFEHQEGLLAVIVPPPALDGDFIEVVHGLRRVFDDDRLSLAASCLYGQDDQARLQQLAMLAEHTRLPLVATNDVQYHEPHRRALHDVLACIRAGCTIEEAGYRLLPNAERHLKHPEEMSRLFAEYPQALQRTVEIADRTAGFNLNQLRYQYPDEVCPPGMTPMEYLKALTWQGARERYGDVDAPKAEAQPCLGVGEAPSMPDKVRRQIEHEFALIEELDYAPYFLTVYDLVQFARSRGILCQGRGAAANSAVCYCLGLTSVDPDRIDVLFERFISRERREPPDIDIDFEHERREEVIQYIYQKYGRERAALTAEVITYRGRSAVRDVGKALGLSLDLVDRLAKNIDWWSDQVTRARGLRDEGLDPHDPTIRRFISLATQIMGFPRHLSQHVGGFVITRDPLCELVPIENARMEDRTVIEWDKDDIDAMGMLKVDVLGLGMLTAVGKCFNLLNAARSGGRAPRQENGRASATALRRKRLALHTVPPEDPAVYDMICKADTIGVFQIESRAQMQMLPRLRPRCFYDLVIEVAIVRPGPIQGDMVHPYLRRRNGQDPIEYPNEAVKAVLGKTLGVPLFQEQAMSLAIVAAGFTPGEADQLRRAMAAWKRPGNLIEKFQSKFINGMLERGYPRDFAERCFNQLKGFSEYGFPESHAASFALIVYVSAWLKKHHPAEFAAALLNSQPMGFYAPAQIVRDAQDHGVEVRPVDMNRSEWDCTIEQVSGVRSQEPGKATPPDTCHLSPETCLRLGMRQVKGLRQDHAELIAKAVREHGPFDSIEKLWRASGVPIVALRRLASADAFNSMGLDRQHALWQVRALHDERLPMFPDEIRHVESSNDESEHRDHNFACRRVDVSNLLPSVPPLMRVMHDYASLNLSLKAHPASFIRELLKKKRVTPNVQLQDERLWPHGQRIAVAGLALVRQRPATASGVVFITIEDETGVANLIVRPKIFEKYRRAARHGIVLLARGTIEREGEVVHIMANSLEMLDSHLRQLTRRSRDFH